MFFLNKLPKDWQPPFCPNRNCRFHHNLPEPWPFKKFGSYVRASDNRKIQRYRCMSCLRTFSTQSFSTTYWQKHPRLDAKIFLKSPNGMCNRQIARDLKTDPATIDHKIARLGRHCILFLAQMAEHLPHIPEIVFDGFETFEYSQYHPFHHNIAVTKQQDYLLYFNDSELRRKGRMTPYQKRKRAEEEAKYGRPEPKAIETAIRELVSVVIGDQDFMRMYTDDHPQYRKPIREYGERIEHIVVPGRAHRDNRNLLWPINLLDRFLRHSSSNHVRETLAWSKRRQASAEHLAIFGVYRNFVLGRRQKDRDSPTPAMELGLVDHRLTVEEIMDHRIFPDHLNLPESWARYYRREVSTRVLVRERRHDLKYAF